MTDELFNKLTSQLDILSKQFTSSHDKVKESVLKLSQQMLHLTNKVDDFEKDIKITNAELGLILEQSVRQELRSIYGYRYARKFKIDSLIGLTRLLTFKDHGVNDEDSTSLLLNKSKMIGNFIQEDPVKMNNNSLEKLCSAYGDWKWAVDEKYVNRLQSGLDFDIRGDFIMIGDNYRMEFGEIKTTCTNFKNICQQIMTKIIPLLSGFDVLYPGKHLYIECVVYVKNYSKTNDVNLKKEWFQYQGVGKKFSRLKKGIFDSVVKVVSVNDL